MHDLVSLKIINHRVACLHRMKGGVRGWCFEERAQFHETMPAAARIESIKSNDIAFVALQPRATRKPQFADSPVVARAFGFNLKAQQVPRLAARIDLFHYRSDLVRREHRRYEIIFKRNEVPDVIDRFRAGYEIIFLIENAVHRPVDRYA